MSSPRSPACAGRRSRSVAQHCSPPRSSARQGRHQVAESLAPHLEIAKLVIGGAGRRKQDDWFGAAKLAGIAGSRRHGLIERATAIERHLVVEGGGKVLRGLPNQEGLLDA